MFSTDDPAQGRTPEPVTFIESQPRVLFPSPVAAVIAAQKANAGEPVRVRVIAPYRVSHEGKSFVGGQTASVPTATAQIWIKSGWVTPAPVSQKRKES